MTSTTPTTASELSRMGAIATVHTPHSSCISGSNTTSPVITRSRSSTPSKIG